MASLRTIHSLPAAAGAAAALLVDLIYLNAIRLQGYTASYWRVGFVALWILACAASGSAGALSSSPRRRAPLLGIAAAGLLAVGIPAAFSFGIPLLLCFAIIGAAAIAATAELPLPRWVQLVAGAVFVGTANGLLWLGFALTPQCSGPC